MPKWLPASLAKGSNVDASTQEAGRNFVRVMLLSRCRFSSFYAVTGDKAVNRVVDLCQCPNVRRRTVSRELCRGSLRDHQGVALVGHAKVHRHLGLLTAQRLLQCWLFESDR